MKKTHWKKLDNPNYLGAYSLMDGSEKEVNVNLTINRVVVETIKTDRGEDEKKVCYFEPTNNKEFNKPMILNSVNSNAIAIIADSPYIEDWKGHSINIFILNFKAFGDFMDGLRIRPPKVLPPISDDRFKKALLSVAKETTSKETIKEMFTLTKSQNEELEAI